MKYFSSIFTTLLALTMVAAMLPGGQTPLTITKASQMWIDGTSSVHDWTCDVGDVQGRITLDAELGEVSKAVVTVPSRAIECDSGAMNKKVAQALKIGDHPAIRYTLKRADVKKNGEELNIETIGSLELAGVTKNLAARLVGKPVGNGTYQFVGSFPVKMSDFGIDPPTAMFGALKTGDDVTVRFEIFGDPAASGLSSSK